MQVRTRVSTLALAASLLATAGTVSACGGSGDDAKALLKRGFSESIPSANVSIDVTVAVKGVPSLSQPIRIKLGGPFKSNGRGKLPSLQWDLSFSGGGQNFSAGVVSTGTQAFINYQGTYYKVDDATMARLQQAAASRSTSGSRSLKAFGVDPLGWIKDASVEGDSTVAGVTTKHVSAGIDIGKLFQDLNKVVARAGGSVGTVKPQQLTPAVIDQIKKVVHDPKIDVYVGKQDGKIRRTAFSIAFDIPQQAQALARGLQGGTLDVSVELAAVGEPQTIRTPASFKPISQLAKQLQGLGLGGLGGGGTGGASPGATAPGATGGTPSADQFRRYAKCLGAVKPGDISAATRCRQFLK